MHVSYVLGPGIRGGLVVSVLHVDEGIELQDDGKVTQAALWNVCLTVAWLLHKGIGRHQTSVSSIHIKHSVRVPAHLGRSSHFLGHLH
jgi:hypothetical protein